MRRNESSEDPQGGSIDEASLFSYACWYLQHFGGTSEALRRALLKKAGRQEDQDEPLDREELGLRIQSVLDRCAQAGFVNDSEYARSKTRSLIDRGVSPSLIRQRLHQKGIGAEVAREALEAFVEEREVDPVFEAALAWARRRRAGPFRAPEERAARRERDLAAACRAGFPYRVAVQILDAPEPPEPGSSSTK